MRVGLQNASLEPFRIAKIVARASSSWSDYVNPTGDAPWTRLTFSGQGNPTDAVISDPSAPVEVSVAPAKNVATPGCGNAPRWTWTDWAPVEDIGPDPATNMRVVMIRWLNEIAWQPFTYVNGLFQHQWTGLAETNSGFDYAIGGYNNGSDCVSNPSPGDMAWDLCARNSPLNGTPIAIVQFKTKKDGIVGMVAGDSHHDGTGTNSGFNGYLTQFATALARKNISELPIVLVNCAIGGISSKEIFERLEVLLPIIQPSFVALPSWSYNEVIGGAHTSLAASEIFFNRVLMAAKTCRESGSRPIFCTPFPRDGASMTPEVRGAWREIREQVLKLASHGEIVLDGGNILAGENSPDNFGTYDAGLSNDGIHPNDNGHKLVAEQLTRLFYLNDRESPVTASDPRFVQNCDDTWDSSTAVKKSGAKMRTLIFCTSYAASIAVWEERWGRWLQAILKSGLAAEKILIVDDGSPVLPDWQRVAIVDAASGEASAQSVEIRHFENRLGQHVKGEPFPGWYRSFAHAVLHGIHGGYDKIIHVEADAFLISDRAIEFFNSSNKGWIALWCPRHQWPETTLQIINRDSFSSAESFFSKPYSAHLGPPYISPEKLIPFTYVHMSLTGDRYGEESEFVPTNIDYVSQVRWNMVNEYYWWLSSDGSRNPAGSVAVRAASQSSNNGSPTVPRILALSMVKNEQDIIEPFIRHSKKFVDFHVVLDNGSVDATGQILLELMRELDGITVTPSSKFGYNQAERMTKLVRACQSAFFADFIIFLDADEFISCESRSEFEKFLAWVPSGGFGCIPWRTFVLTPFSDEALQNDPPRTIRWRRRQEVERNNIVLRLDGKYWHDLTVSQGNHSVSSTTGRQIESVRLEGLFLDHFPLRSRNQFLGKSIVGWAAYLGKDPLAAKKGDGYHWRENFQLAAESSKFSYEVLCHLSMIYDHPPRDYEWSIDVVRDCPPDEYTRLYSTGEYAEPLGLVAKSWAASLEQPAAPVTFTRPAGIEDLDDERSRGETAFDPQWHWENFFMDVAPFQYIAVKYKPDSVFDVGCGIGAYLILFKHSGSSKVLGVDGIPISATILRSTEYREVDLSQPISLDRKFDLVMCLEVAEHLPEDSSSTLMDTVRQHAGGLIIFSAAEPGQPGHGHINTVAISEWLQRWGAVGWFPVLDETLAMRALATLPWFKRNIIVLRKGANEATNEAVRHLQMIGAKSYSWQHCDPGVRNEILIGDMPQPPFGYISEAFGDQTAEPNLGG
jgi:SAM-dependent methyltransferase